VIQQGTGLYIKFPRGRREFELASDEQLVAHRQNDRANEQADKAHRHESSNRTEKYDRDGNCDASP